MKDLYTAAKRLYNEAFPGEDAAFTDALFALGFPRYLEGLSDKGTLCSMLLNPDRLLMTIPVKYYGFEINDQWLAGYGLDHDEIGRNLPYIAQIPKRK